MFREAIVRPGGAGMGRRRWRGDPRKGISRRKIFFFVLVLFAFLSLQSFIFVEKNLRPPLMNVAKIRVKQIATQAINTAISERIAQKTDSQKLIDWRTDNNGKVTGFMLNYSENMKITSQTIDVVQRIFQHMEDVPERIPLGEAVNSAILSSFGPRVPIKLVPAGAVKVDLETRKQDAGINMLLVEVYIHIVAEVSIIIPFDTQPELVETEVPISYVLVVGDVPTYYLDSKGNPIGNVSASSLNVPKVTEPAKEGKSK